LERFGGEKKNALAAAKSGSDDRVEDGRGLTAAGWRTHQEVPPLGQGVGDSVTDLLLRRSQLVVREGERLRGFAQLFEARDPSFLAGNQTVDLLAEPGVNRIR
jgi:hypothetical protein